VTDPISARIETADEVRDLVLEAAKFVDPARLGTTDNCGFSPFGDDTSTSRETAFAKIRARVQGTAMASESDPAAASPRSSRSRNVEDVDHLGVSFVACGVMAWYAHKCTQALPVRSVRYAFIIPGGTNWSRTMMTDTAAWGAES
jgi:hypothetical protein